MENIEINAKMIIIVILIAAVIGTLLWVGYNIYTETTEEENDGIENFESNITSDSKNNIQAQINNNNNHSNDNTEFNISDIVGDVGFEINNSNATNPGQGWLKRMHNFSRISGYNTMYYVPNDWNNKVFVDEKNGVTIEASTLKIKNLTKDTSYEDFLNMFIEEKQKNTSLPKGIEYFSKRSFYINGEKFYVIVEKGHNKNWMNEYFCLAKDQYAHYLEVGISKDNYNQEAINLLDEIFSTFRILK